MPALTLSGGQTLALGSSAVKAAYLGSELKHFNPKVISDLEVWNDFSDASTLFQGSDGTTPATAPGDPVGYAYDKSGNGRHATQSVANNRPTIAADTFNGRRGLTFDGSNDYLSYGNISSAFSSQAGTAFIVFTANDNLYMLFRTRTNYTNLWSNSGSFTFEGSWRTARLSQVASGGSLTVVASPKVYSLQSSASVYEVKVDETVVASASAQWNAGDDYTIAGSPADTYMASEVYEVLLYSRILSASEGQSVRGYLYAKWGV